MARGCVACAVLLLLAWAGSASVLSANEQDVAMDAALFGPAAPRTVLGHRAAAPNRLWKDEGPAEMSDYVSFIVALKQRGLARLEEIFWDVSDPFSPRYGQYLSHAEVEAIVSPGAAAFSLVKQWLAFHQLHEGADYGTSMDAIVVTCSVEKAEALLSTTIHRFSHQKAHPDSYVLRQMGQFSVPSAVARAVDHVFGLSEFIEPRRKHRHAAANVARESILRHSSKTKARDVKIPQLGAFTPVTPAVLRQYYDVPDGLNVTNPHVVQSVFAAMQYFNHEALTEFGLLVGVDAKIDKYIGLDCWTSSHVKCESFEEEADLDVQYITAMAPGAQTWFWETSDTLNTSASTIQWILSWAIQVNNQSASVGVPLVHSISYGFPEVWQCYIAQYCRTLGYDYLQYINRTDVELMKMGVRGWTVLVASGDDGAAGFASNYEIQPDPKYPNACQQVIVKYRNETCIFPTGIYDSFSCSPVFGLAYAYLEAYASNHTIGSCFYNMTGVQSWGPTEDSKFFSNCSCSQLPTFTATNPETGDNFTISGWTFDATNGLAFFPDYPASSPYITSVGATQFVCNEGGTYPNGVCKHGNNQSVSSVPQGARITSGGGFSGVHPAPRYQRQAIKDYLGNALPDLPPLDYFDPSRRAYPDVSMNGHNYLILTSQGAEIEYDIRLTYVDGTSCSAPALAGFLSMWNDQLLNQGHPPLGFFNPLLYAMAANRSETMYDITTGDNSCLDYTVPWCSRYGFPATRGWDAATGWGTPDFEQVAWYLAGFMAERRKL